MKITKKQLQEMIKE